MMMRLTLWVLGSALALGAFAADSPKGAEKVSPYTEANKRHADPATGKHDAKAKNISGRGRVSPGRRKTR